LTPLAPIPPAVSLAEALRELPPQALPWTLEAAGGSNPAGPDQVNP
jgi:hypothetical protein